MDLITKTANTKPGKKVKLGNRRWPKIIAIIFAFIFILALGLFFVVYLPAKELQTKIEAAKTEVDHLKQSINEKDLEKIKINLSVIKDHTKSIEDTYFKLKPIGFLPIINNYYQDGLRTISIAKNSLDTSDIIIKAIEPYKDFLGMTGSAASSEETTQDRIAFLTQSVEGLIPYLDTIEAKIAEIDKSAGEINPSRYPEEFRGYQIKSNITKAQELLSQSHKLIKDGKPLLSKVSWLLGKDSPRKYLMIFQNDGELRPSGGFWTAYSTMTVDNGKVKPGTASNIYDLDDRINSRTPAPRLIKSYHINVPYLNLRDSNLSPDFPTDAKIFLDQYLKATGSKEKFDAIIAIDTQLLVDMVAVLGKLDTRVGTFTTEPDKRCYGCPQIIYEMQWMSGRPRDYIEKNRKDFMNPLMSALLANVMGSEKNKMGQLIQAGFKSINEKHVLFYFPNEDNQKMGDLANITGKIYDTESSVDYLHLNDTNFASAKSNIFITQKIKHDITIKNGQAQHKINITYTNSAPGSNCNLEKGGLCLNASTYRDIFRFYTPKGSKLTKMTGSEVETVQYEELNKQVFEGFYGNKFGLNPQSNLKTSIEYTSGAQIGSVYTLMLQKQPGTKPVDYELIINGSKQNFSWVADKTIRFTL
ncbi:MAG TPA: DUF4012 domain-containing protein [Candidatus Woesebacteria bacterium]|jgi:hypothetical protein|nr:DUF4012 domain-containing protein [Candidatus Woesebacteria bacterium]HOG37343.1 DUF4012 domain-containing protein [Candidatus Woesebacteria bacterium]